MLEHVYIILRYIYSIVSTVCILLILPDLWDLFILKYPGIFQVFKKARIVVGIMIIVHIHCNYVFLAIAFYF